MTEQTDMTETPFQKLLELRATIEILGEAAAEAGHQLDVLRAAVRSLLPLAERRARDMTERPLLVLEATEALETIRTAREVLAERTP